MTKQYRGKDYSQLLNEHLFGESPEDYNFPTKELGRAPADPGSYEGGHPDDPDYWADEEKDSMAGMQELDPSGEPIGGEEGGEEGGEPMGSASASWDQPEVRTGPEGSAELGDMGEKVQAQAQMKHMQTIMDNLPKLPPKSMAALAKAIKKMVRYNLDMPIK